MALFRLAAWLVMRLARLAPSAPIRGQLGVANLHRPGAATPLLMLSVGLGLATLATVAQIQNNIRQQILDQIPTAAPTFFFVDIQNDQMDRFRALANAVPGVTEIRDVPSLRARVVAIKGVPVEQANVTPETAWALKGDRGLTYAAAPPEHTRLVAGHWWPENYDGPPLVSFDAGLAKGWHVGIGDTIRVNVLGRDIDLRVASLRDIAWQSLSINFFMVASPGMLSHAPHTHIATVRVDPAHEAALLRSVTDALPNVTGIRVADVLTAISALLDQIAGALAATGLLTLAGRSAGPGQRGRRRPAPAYAGGDHPARTGRHQRPDPRRVAGRVRAAGARRRTDRGPGRRRRQLRGRPLYYAHANGYSPARILIFTLAGGLATMLVFGYAGLNATVRARPAQLLRNE